MGRLAVVLPLLLIVLACTRAEKTETAAARREATMADASVGAADAAPRNAPARDLRTWTSDWPKGWTDPRVLAALAEDCGFVPVRPRITDDQNGEIPPDVFACSLGYSQSCTIDPCIVPSSTCEHGCEGACDTCGTSCVASCRTCKDGCGDGTDCKRACATKCADCKQTCTRTMDRCVTGDCSKVHAQCNARLRAVWAGSNCKARCAVFGKCQAACTGSNDEGACNERCEAKLSPGGKACHDACDALRDTDPKGATMCVAKCFETAPCSSFLCQGWDAAR